MPEMRCSRYLPLHRLATVKPMPLDRYPSKGSWFVSTPQSEEVWNWDRGYGESHDGSLKAIHFLG
ncbi:MAG: hypothetical protein QOI97_5157 [Pseudomonas sp.]|jgi:hypothetical protein|nr:hypothetical protein [Pseudomonas sp.]